MFLLVFPVVSISMAQNSGSFELEELYKQAKEEGGNYLRFIDNERLSSGIYQLKKGDVDNQQPHQYDELYYILEGKATLKVENERYEARPGSILFVKAEIEHTFVDIEEDLKVLVFFSKKND